MTIRCPRCGKTGDLPEHLGPTVRGLRCRNCLMRFSLRSATDVASRNRSNIWSDSRPADRPTAPCARIPFPAELVGERANDDPLSMTSEIGDSQYELPARTENGDDDSQVELPAFEPGGVLSDDEFPAYTDDRPSGELLAARPR